MRTSTFAIWLCTSLFANAGVIESAVAKEPTSQPTSLGTAIRHVGLDHSQLAALRAASMTDLEHLRAGLTVGPSVLGDDERAALASAEEQSPGLDLMRAGEISNEDLGTILIIAAVIIVVAILL